MEVNSDFEKFEDDKNISSVIKRFMHRPKLSIPVPKGWLWTMEKTMLQLSDLNWRNHWKLPIQYQIYFELQDSSNVLL